MPRKIFLDLLTKYFFLAARFFFLQQVLFSYCKKNPVPRKNSGFKKKIDLSLYQENIFLASENIFCELGLSLLKFYFPPRFPPGFNLSFPINTTYNHVG